MDNSASHVTAESRLTTFLARFDPGVRAIAVDVRDRLRQRLPGAIEMVYDNYNALVIGYSPTERVSDAVFSIAIYPRWVNLFFLNGVGLPDPENLLQGEGNVVRHIRLDDPALLDKPAIKTLMKHGLKRMETPFDKDASGKLIIKSVAPKQRSRRPS